MRTEPVIEIEEGLKDIECSKSRFMAHCRSQKLELLGILLCILYHLLMNREDYQEPEVEKTKPKIPSCISPVSMMDIDEMIRIICRAGYLVEKDLKEGGG